LETFRNKKTKQNESARIMTLFAPNTAQYFKLCTTVCFLHEPARFVQTQWKFTVTQLEVQLLKSWKF